MFGGLRNILLFTIIGLLIIASSQGQTSTAVNFTEKIDEVMDKFYFSNLDSCLQELDKIGVATKASEQWDQYLYVIVNKFWVAEHHKAFDSLYKYIEDADKFVAKYRAALDDLDPDGAILEEVIYNKGMLQYHSGNMRGAIDEFAQLIQNGNAENQDSLDAFSNYLNLGQLYYRIDDYENAGIHFRLAASILPKAYPGYEGSGRNYGYQLSLIENSIGKFHFMKGKLTNDKVQLGLAHGFFHKALHRIEHRKNESSIQNLLLNIYQKIADYHKETKQYDSAIFYIDKLLSVPRDNEVEQMKNHLYAGEVYLANNNVEKARGYFTHSLDLAKKKYPQKHYRVAQALYHIGKTFASGRQWKNSLEYYQKAIAALVEDFNYPEDIYRNPDIALPSMEKEMLEVLVLKADALTNIDDPGTFQGLKAAIDTYVLAAQLIDRMRMGFQLTESRQFLSAKSLTIYENAVASCFKAFDNGLGYDYLDKAFYFMEKNKSRLILEGLTESAARKFAQIPAELLETETKLKGKLSLLKQDLFEQTDTDKQDELRKAIFDARQDYDRFIDELETNYPKYFNAKFNADIPSISEVQQHLLHPNEIVIEYFYGEKAVYGVAMTREKVVLRKLTSSTKLDPMIKDFVRQVSHFDVDNAFKPENFNALNALGFSLHELLVDPLISALDPTNKELTIIQDGLIGYIPFGVLITAKSDPGNASSYAELPYLIKSNAIGYGYSCTLRYNEKINESLVSTKDFQYLGLAPSYPGYLAAEYQPNKGGQARDGFSMLQNNQPEVETVAGLFNGLKFLGSTASESNFKEYAPKSSILHLSMHAFTNDQNPLYSALVFAKQRSGEDKNITTGLFEAGDQAIGVESENDGLLYAYELYNMDLQADVALLSACDTGVGELAKGEGIMSIGRAFKHAGCRNITMSLWKANDKTTSQIMKSFGSSLLDGLTIDKALRVAKLEYLESADKIQAHPYFWATFITVGNSDPIKAGSHSNWLKILIGGGLLLIVGLYVLLKKTKR